MQRNINKIDKDRMIYFIVLVAVSIVYFCVLGENGVVFTKDSVGFIKDDGILPVGYMVYPAFVQLFISLLGEKMGLIWIWLFQGLFAMGSSVYIVEWIRKKYDLKYHEGVLIYFLSILPYGYTLPEYVLTHEIMTEGLAIPIFNLLFLFLLRWVLEPDNKKLLVMFGLMVVLVLTRPQLLTTFVAVLGVIFIAIWGRSVKTWRGRCISGICGVGVCVLGILFLPSLMLWTMKIMPQFAHAVSGKVLCTIEKQDRELFTGLEQDAFDYVYDKVDNAKHRTLYMRNDIFRSEDIIIAVNDNAKYHLKYFHEYCEEKEKELGVDILENNLRNKVLNTLFLNNFTRYVGLMCQILPYSFVASIFIQPDAIKTLCYIITTLLYLFSFIIYGIGRRKKIPLKYIRPFEITMTILIVNVIFTNVVFYAQQRYVIYTFGWFYISIFLMLLRIYRDKKQDAR